MIIIVVSSVCSLSGQSMSNYDYSSNSLDIPDSFDDLISETSILDNLDVFDYKREVKTPVNSDSSEDYDFDEVYPSCDSSIEDLQFSVFWIFYYDNNFNCLSFFHLIDRSKEVLLPPPII